MEIKTITIKGIYRDILKNKDDIIVFDSGWNSNTIVIGCRTLLAGFVKNDSPKGIQYLAVGQGKQEWDALWDAANPPAPAPEEVTNLENPHAVTKLFDKLELLYLDENDLRINDGKKTSRLQIKATLEPGYPAPLAPLKTYPLREFGLFGKFEDDDYMINCIRHPVIHKDESATLERVIRLYF